MQTVIESCTRKRRSQRICPFGKMFPTLKMDRNHLVGAENFGGHGGPLTAQGQVLLSQ